MFSTNDVFSQLALLCSWFLNHGFSGLILRVGEFANVKATNNKAQLNLYFSEHKESRAM